jgi:hypothetical protein
MKTLFVKFIYLKILCLVTCQVVQAGNLSHSPPNELTVGTIEKYRITIAGATDPDLIPEAIAYRHAISQFGLHLSHENEITNSNQPSLGNISNSPTIPNNQFQLANQKMAKQHKKTVCDELNKSLEKDEKNINVLTKFFRTLEKQEHQFLNKHYRNKLTTLSHDKAFELKELVASSKHQLSYSYFDFTNISNEDLNWVFILLFNGCKKLS